VLLGCRVSVKSLKKFTIFFNLNDFLRQNKVFACSSGTYCSFIQYFRDFNLVKVKLPSTKNCLILGESLGTLGRNSNIFKKYRVLGSAKSAKNLGRSPVVRGVAMNPIDHPHGGRTKTNSPEVSIWG